MSSSIELSFPYKYFVFFSFLETEMYKLPLQEIKHVLSYLLSKEINSLKITVKILQEFTCITQICQWFLAAFGFLNKRRTFD